MRLGKTIIVWVVAIWISWILVIFIVPVIQILLGHATGIGAIVPRSLRGLPRASQFVLLIVGIPILLGVIGGSAFYLVAHHMRSGR